MNVALLLGAVVSAALRRWPGIALSAGALIAWATYTGWPTQFPNRAAPVLAALLLAITPGHLRRAVAAPAALLGIAGMVWIWAGYRELSEIILTTLALSAGMIGTVALIDRSSDRGAWSTVGIITMGTALLVALTGSVRLSQEVALIALPMLALSGRPLENGAGYIVGLLLGGAVGAAVIFSALGWAAAIPLLCLLALPLGQRKSWAAPAAALGIGLVTSAPVVISWIQDPPF